MEVVRRIIVFTVRNTIKQQKHAFGIYILQRQHNEKQQEHELCLEYSE